MEAVSGSAVLFFELFAEVPLWGHLLFTRPIALLLAFRTFSTVVGLVSGLGEEVVITGWKTLMVNQLIQDPKKLKIPISTTLLSEFKTLGFSRGEHALQKLESVTSDLKGIFTRNPDLETSLVNTGRIKELADSLHLKGISFLSDTLRIARQSNPVSLLELAEQVEDLETQLEKHAEEKGTVYSLILERLEKNRHNLALVKKSSNKVDELLCHVGLCVDSLREICLELPELIGHKSRDDFDKVVLELNSRIDYAQRVKAEYDKQGI